MSDPKPAERKSPFEGPLEILFDGPPAHEAGRFIEAEIDGRGVNCGEWVERDGYWRLVIRQDIAAPTLLRQRDELAEVLRSVRGWLTDERMGTVSYMETHRFYEDAARCVSRIDAALAKLEPGHE